MGDLTDHFYRSEFACSCCRVVKVRPKLLNALEDLRSLLGRPITVTSGYRCPNHNAAVGGENNSQHLLGIAADVVVTGFTPNKIREYAGRIAAFRNGGIGVYPSRGFTHLDVRQDGPPAGNDMLRLGFLDRVLAWSSNTQR